MMIILIQEKEEALIQDKIVQEAEIEVEVIIEDMKNIEDIIPIIIKEEKEIGHIEIDQIEIKIEIEKDIIKIKKRKMIRKKVKFQIKKNKMIIILKIIMIMKIRVEEVVLKKKAIRKEIVKEAKKMIINSEMFNSRGMRSRIIQNNY